MSDKKNVLHPPVSGIYRHYKGGLHSVSGVTARHSETGELLVLYSNGNETFAHPLDSWHSEPSPGVSRFTKVNL